MAKSLKHLFSCIALFPHFQMNLSILLFVNDLPDNIKSRILLFADDLKLIANAMNKDLVDEDLRSLERWEGLWQLRFNLDKCKVLHIAGNDNPINKYCLDGTKKAWTAPISSVDFNLIPEEKSFEC